MRTPPHIPGLDAYPELAKKFRQKFRIAEGDRRCASCEINRLVHGFRERVAALQRRDKPPKRV